jgi:anion-transporting  ArsA/GET3 family ATPase
MSDIDELLATRRVIVCCGSGGVGKTTVAAALALSAARRGRRAVVITIDPARRLADALGRRGELSNEPVLVERIGQGEMWAAMLDVTLTFDSLIERFAASAEQAEIIRSNVFYKSISGSLSGTRDYMAAEMLLRLHEDPRFDLVVLDTAPSRNALDFIESPERLVRFLRHPLFRILTAPSRGGLRVIGATVQPILKVIGKVVGSNVMSDVIDFLRAFEGMEAGFASRASSVSHLLRGDGTDFALVLAPSPEPLSDTQVLVERLADTNISPSLLFANRLTPRFDVTGEPSTDALQNADAVQKWLDDNVAALRQRAETERELVQTFIDHMPSTPPGTVGLVEIVEQPTDIHDLDGIARLADSFG